MLNIRSNGKQHLLDIAIQYYGNADALFELLELNPLLRNISAAISREVDILIDEESPLRNQAEIDRMKGAEVSTHVQVRWYNYADAYFNTILAASKKVLLYKDMVAADRFVRDLKGEFNPLYHTLNQLNRFHGLYPMLAGDDAAKSYNLAEPGVLGGGLIDIKYIPVGPDFVKRYYLPTGPATGYYDIQDFEYENGIGNADFCCGVFALETPKGNLMGVADGAPIDFGFVLREHTGGKLLFAPTGLAVGTTYAESASGIAAPGLISGDSEDGDVSVWIGNTNVGQVLLDTGYSATPLTGAALGSIINSPAADDENKIGFAYFGKGFGTDAQGLLERTAFFNAVYYYMYQRGAIKEFTPFV